MQAWCASVAKEKRATLPGPPEWIQASIGEADAGGMANAYRTSKKQERGAKVQAAKEAIMAKLQDDFDRKEVAQEHVCAPCPYPCQAFLHSSCALLSKFYRDLQRF